MKTKKQVQLARCFVSILIATALTISVIVIGKKSQAQNTGATIADAGVAKSDSPPWPGSGAANQESPPAFVTEMPAGYRDWRLISVAHEDGTLNDIRAILGNDVAIQSFRAGKLPFPEGTIIARLAWNYVASEENNNTFGRRQSFVAGHPTNGVQFMVKDSKKYAATGGWGYARFNDGKPATEVFMQSCYPCHQAIKSRDFVFTRYSP